MAIKMECSECGFTAQDDYKLIEGHSCEVTRNGGRCIDYPACGHERGDCNGLLYGSDDKIKADVYRAMRDPDGFGLAYEAQMEYEEYWSRY